jgi:hypothetical protein
MNYENIIYFISPNQNFHPSGLFKDKHSKALFFPTLFIEQFQQFFEGFSYQQIAQWELLHTYEDFSTNIFIFSKVIKISIQQVIGSS